MFDQILNSTNLLKFINDGGVLMYVILSLNVISFSVIFYKLAIVFSTKYNLKKEAEKISDKIFRKTSILEAQISLAKELSSNKVQKLENGLGIVKTTANLSPLLGLLGTVMGIFEAFKLLSVEGMNDPSVFAGGISFALITTIGGLVVAIPNYFFYSYITSHLDSIEVRLEESILDDLIPEQKVEE